MTRFARANIDGTGVNSTFIDNQQSLGRRILARAHSAVDVIKQPRQPTHRPRRGTKRSLVVKSESAGADSARPAGSRARLTLTDRTVNVGRHGTSR
jgi:hypothetical protein